MVPRQPTYKFGVKIPRNYSEALRFDDDNKNDLWKEAMQKEVAQILEYNTFDNIGINGKLPDGYKKIGLQFVLDCNHNYRRKARMVDGGHRTDPPKDSTYSSIVSLCGLRIVMFIGELNGMTLRTGDIGNAYLEAMTTEKSILL